MSTRMLRRSRDLVIRRKPGSALGEDEILARLAAETAAPRFCVDLGAGDGTTMSNSFRLYAGGWRGLAVELDGERFAALAAEHSKRDLTLLRARITPQNVTALLAAAETPRDFGILTIDLDGYDYFVLESLLASYRPAVVCAEINEKIPPPLRFTVRYTPDYAWDVSHFYGQSISQVGVLCERHEYAIVELEYNNVFLVPREAARVSLAPEEAYARGYANRADRRERFPWNEDMEALQTMAPPEGASFLRDRFRPYGDRYLLEY